MLADILYALLLLVSVIAVIAVFRHIRSLRRTSNIPSERLFVLMLVMLIGVFCGYLALNNQINKLGQSSSDQEKTEKEVFVEQLYPPLYLTQKQLNSQVINLSDLQKQIIELRDEHPQQKERLQLTYSVWHRERKVLVKLKNELDKFVHKAWSYHRKLDKNFVENKFSREAVDWDTALKNRLAEYRGSQVQVTNAMLDNVMWQRKSLSKLAVGKGIPPLVDGVLRQSAFSAATVEKLLDALRENASDSASLLDSISQEVNLAAQRRREVRNYALDKPNLQATLQRLMKDWLALENRGIYYRDQALHAVQADYLARVLGVNYRDNQMMRLDAEISKKLPSFLDNLTASRKLLEQSYQFAPR